MHNFIYVPKSETKPVKEEIIHLLTEVQDDIRDQFTFYYRFIGSCSRNMITCDLNRNIGFDFDVNIYPNDPDEKFQPVEIRNIIKNSINKYCHKYKFNCVQDQTIVMTIKNINYINSKILHSCDFAIVFDCDDGRQQYIRHNKSTNKYTWEYRDKGFDKLPDKIDWLKANDLWPELKEYYLYKKNNNTDNNKHSRSLFAESIHEVCQQNGYKRK